MTEYYKPRDILFSSEQVVWLIENRDLLMEGKWPPECVSTGYSGQTGKARGHSATFETPIACVAELNYRLARTGIPGQWLVREVQQGVSIGELPYQPRCALNYVAGWYRKRLSFRDWVRQIEARRLKGKTLHKMGYLTHST